jgi:hypothetical protein
LRWKVRCANTAHRSYNPQQVTLPCSDRRRRDGISKVEKETTGSFVFRRTCHRYFVTVQRGRPDFEDFS